MNQPALLPTSIRTISEGSEDLDFDELLHKAIDRIQKLAGEELRWTDYNLHDPGLTLLEAILWAMSDLRYRTDIRAHWNRRICFESPLALCVEAAPTKFPIEENDRSRLASTRRLWLQFALDYFDQAYSVSQQTDSNPKRTEQLPELQSRLQGLWDSLEHNVNDRTEPSPPSKYLPPIDIWTHRIRAWSLDSLPNELKERLFELRNDAAQSESDDAHAQVDAQVKQTLGWCPSRAEILASGIRKEVAPDQCEDDRGGALVWPPLPTQMLSVAPCLADDYAARLQAHWHHHGTGEVHPSRLWVVTGRACGITWDGQPVQTPVIDLPGTVSLLVDPEGRYHQGKSVSQQVASEQRKGFLDHCRRAFYDQAPCVADSRRYWNHEDILSGVEIHRTLCDEVCVGIVGRKLLHLRIRVLIDPSFHKENIRKEVSDVISDGLYFGFKEQRAFGYELANLDRRVGWLPNLVVRPTEIRNAILHVVGVEQITDLSMSLDDGADKSWTGDAVALPAYTVPTIGNCTISVQRVTNTQ